MDERLNFQISRLSDVELRDCIDNRQNYMPDTIETAMAELQKRGLALDSAEMQVISEDITALRDNVKLQVGYVGLFSSVYKNNIVADPFAPVLYSRSVINGFTFFMGALFGSIMLAINASNVKNQKGVLLSLLFGVLYTVVQIILIFSFHLGPPIGLFFSIIAAYCVNYFLWPRIIGNETFYCAKPFWVPLIIAVLLTASLIYKVLFYPDSLHRL